MCNPVAIMAAAAVAGTAATVIGSNQARNAAKEQAARLTPRTPLPADLLQPCPAIEKRPLADLGELLTFTTDLVEQYGECAARQRKLAEAAR